LAIHAKRVTIQVKDLKLAVEQNSQKWSDKSKLSEMK